MCNNYKFKGEICSVKHWLTLGWRLADTWPTLSWRLADVWLTFGWHLADPYPVRYKTHPLALQQVKRRLFLDSSLDFVRLTPDLPESLDPRFLHSPAFLFLLLLQAGVTSPSKKGFLCVQHANLYIYHWTIIFIALRGHRPTEMLIYVRLWWI